MSEDPSLVTPVDLGLGAGHHLEPAVQAREFAWDDPELGRDPGAGFLQLREKARRSTAVLAR
ncbi:hypothetical protein [Streptomyces sp.]|jgi:hypothetical protein